ncbi:60S ribosomal protein L32 [Lachnellula arida]|uniref:60S ribosomal protein L32 n=1 Tax=Lachnellula arida TaxID=1316785 RepID=A0A8T9BNX0_9HELO|nr:60S ribosomal protein L32 [Lachnellula arida]
MVSAKKHVPIVKKRTKRFHRHQSELSQPILLIIKKMCLDASWRKPKGSLYPSLISVSIIAFAVVLRAKWSCHRYVQYKDEVGGGGRRTSIGILLRSLEASKPPPTSDTTTRTKLIRTLQIGFGSNKKTRHMMPSGHKAFLVNNTRDVELLLMHNKTFAAEISHAVSSRKRIDIIQRAKELGVKVTNPKARVTTEV